MNKTPEDLITDTELEMVWGNADFGNIPKREIIIGAIKKVAQGWSNGSTSTAIIRELGLTEFRNGHDGLSDKGLEYLIAAAQFTPQVEEVVREFDSNKYYWCKCEICGWEDSSQFCAGGHAIADTGDHSDVLCPVCFSSKIEGEPTIDAPQYEGVVPIKMPLDLILAPYIKIIRHYQKIEDDKHWDEMDKMADFITTTPQVEVREVWVDAIKRMKDDSGREGCTYGDTDYDSLSAVYGYNLAVDNISEWLSKQTIPNIEKDVVFRKIDWDKFKQRMGNRNYQGLINIEDFVQIIGELENKSL